MHPRLRHPRLKFALAADPEGFLLPLANLIASPTSSPGFSQWRAGGLEEWGVRRIRVALVRILRKQREFSACGAQTERKQAESFWNRKICVRGFEGKEGLEADRICGINRCCWDLGGPNCSVGGASFRELWRRGRRGQEKFGGMDTEKLRVSKRPFQAGEECHGK